MTTPDTREQPDMTALVDYGQEASVPAGKTDKSAAPSTDPLDELERLAKLLRDRVAEPDGWCEADLLLPAADGLDSLIAQAREAERMRGMAKDLCFIARTSGGTAGPDAVLMAACAAVEAALSPPLPSPGEAV